MKRRYGHRCLSCFNSWFTNKADRQALCPSCKSSNQDTYILGSAYQRSHRLIVQAVFLLCLFNLVLFVGVVYLIAYRL